MARYIDVDKLIAEYDRVHIGVAGGARKLMVEAPTADVVEVVRCKDCGMSRETEDERFLFCMQFADTVDCQAFCSYGERSETKVQEVKKDVR